MTVEDFTTLFGFVCLMAAVVLGIMIFISPLIIISRLSQIIDLLKKLNQK